MLLDHIVRRIVFGAFLVSIFSCTLYSESQLPNGVQGVDVVEHVGQQLPLDQILVDQNGSSFALKDIVGSRPVVVSFGYYGCPMLCGLVTGGLRDVIKLSGFEVGKDFDVLTISIDPTDTPETAKKFSDGLPWKFAVGKESVVSLLAKTVGFGYRYDASTDEYAHAACIMILTKNGTISRYLYGASFKPLDFKLAIAEAKEGKMVSTVEHVLLFCYNYDSNSKGYVLGAQRVMKIGALLTVVVLGGLLMFLHRRKSKDKFIK
jgi:protein SCO1/2